MGGQNEEGRRESGERWINKISGSWDRGWDINMEKIAHYEK
jgi:hypothetical protein